MGSSPLVSLSCLCKQADLKRFADCKKQKLHEAESFSSHCNHFGSHIVIQQESSLTFVQHFGFGMGVHMAPTRTATYDGKVFCPDQPLALEPNTGVTLLIEIEQPIRILKQSCTFLKAARGEFAIPTGLVFTGMITLTGELDLSHK